MATRAETARARAERAAHGRKPKKGPSRTKTARARVREEAERYSSGNFAGGVTATRNVKEDRGGNETHDLEDSADGRPSRKSTRKGGRRAKPDSQLRNKAVRRARSPESRASSRAS